LHVIFETCPPTRYVLTSGEPAPIVQVKLDEPALTLIDPLPSAVIEKSPASASAELEEFEDELEEVTELDELEAVWLAGGRSRSIVSSTPSAQTILTVEPTRKTLIAGRADVEVIRHDLPSTVIAWLFRRASLPLAVHLGWCAASPAGAVSPASTTAMRAIRPTSRELPETAVL
jgi:hypothetical protein